MLQQLEVAQQAACLDHFGVALRVEGSPEEDVLADGPGENHQILLAVAHLALDLGFTAVEGQFVEEDLEEGSLAAADRSAESIELALLDGEIDVFEDWLLLFSFRFVPVAFKIYELNGIVLHDFLINLDHFLLIFIRRSRILNSL